jgi:hypothetical protein
MFEKETRMYWDQFAKDFRRLLTKAASGQSAAPEESPCPLDAFAACPSGGDRTDEEEMTPYSPDDSGERSDSSLHLSC